MESMAAPGPDKHKPHQNSGSVHDAVVVLETAAAAEAATPENENSGDHNHIATVPQILHFNLTRTSWAILCSCQTLKFSPFGSTFCVNRLLW